MRVWDISYLNDLMSSVIDLQPPRHAGVRKTRLIHTLRSLQRAPFGFVESIDDELPFFLEYDNRQLDGFMLHHTLLSMEEVANDLHIIPEMARTALRHQIKEGWSKVENVTPNFAQLVRSLLGTARIINTPEQDGGSVSSAIGFIYLSPKQSWTATYTGEMIVHETMHNVLFLIDMVEGLFPDLGALHRKEALVTSVIRKELRPFDKSFHSAVVAMTLARYNMLCGNQTRAANLVLGIPKTITEMRVAVEKCLSCGVGITTDLGYDIIDDMSRELIAYDSVL